MLKTVQGSGFSHQAKANILLEQGSDRSFWRIDEAGKTAVLMKSQKVDDDFNRYLDIGHFLYENNLGAPQIMGFNYKGIGYKSVQDMFKHFKKDIKYQILALFDFCLIRDEMIQYLKDKDFVSFASIYNGPKHPEKYGGWMKDYYEAFKSCRKE